MKRVNLLFLSVICALLLVGCAKPKNLIVLIPDADGSVGELSVTTAAGKQTINQPYQAVEVAGGDKAPASPKAIAPEEVTKTFGSAIKARPLGEDRFTLYFFTGTTRLKEDSKALVPQILESINQRRIYDIFAIGHTDTMGGDRLNMKLSLKRARSVKELLVSKGVDPDRIFVTYYGERDPLVPTADNVNEPRNRRVEIVVQ